MPKLRVTAVSYLNTKPFLYGIFKSGLSEEIDLRLDIPSECARKLASGEADLGLVPVAVLPQLSSPAIISDFCIGTEGTVRTVCLFSQRPLEELTHVYLDFHSRTSVELLRILLEKHWHHSPVLLPSEPGFEKKIKGTTGALVIGDRAIELRESSKFTYDLGEAWLAYSGLPFVFAAWASNCPLDEGFVERLNEALESGIRQIPQLIYLLPSPSPRFDLYEYFTKNISYTLDERKLLGMRKFLSEISGETAHLMNMKFLAGVAV